MIKVKGKPTSINEVEKLIKRKVWRGEPISNVAIVGEEINLKTHPYTFLFAIGKQLSNEGGIVPNIPFSWRAKVFLINRIYDIRRVLRDE